MSVSESWLCKACKSFNILRVRFGFASGSNCFPNTLPMLKNNKCNIYRTTLLKLRLSNMGSCLLTDLRFAHQSRCPGSFYHPSKRCGHCPARETGSLYHGNRCVGTLTVTGLLRLWSTKRWNFLSSEFRMTSSSTDCTDIVKQSSKVPRRHDPFEASMWHKPTPKPKLSMVV